MKIKIAVLITVFFTSVMFSQSIKILNPKAGEFCTPGKIYNIKWIVSGKMNSFVKIRLFSVDGSKKLLSITNKTANTGIFPWNIPGNLDGASGFIRVKTIDDSYFGDSSPFQIGIPEKKVLMMYSPMSGVSFSPGDKIKIDWSGSGLHGNLNIFLDRSDGSVKTPIKMNYPADKSPAYYTIPAGTVPGTYKCRVVWGSIVKESGIFTIKGAGQKKSLDIMEPKSGSEFDSGSYLPIVWVGSGLAGNTVKVLLCKGTPGINQVALISNNWPNSPHFQGGWQIPSIFSTGNYKVVVIDGNTTAFHGHYFKINKVLMIKNRKPGLNKINIRDTIIRNSHNRFSSRKNPFVFSFKANGPAKKMSESRPGKVGLYIVKLNFSWRDDDGDLANGKWHCSSKGMTSGIFVILEGTFRSILHTGGFNGTSGSVKDFMIPNIKGFDKEKTVITLLIEDRHGNLSNKVKTTVTLETF